MAMNTLVMLRCFNRIYFLLCLCSLCECMFGLCCAWPVVVFKFHRSWGGRLYFGQSSFLREVLGSFKRNLSQGFMDARGRMTHTTDNVKQSLARL